MSLFGKIFGGKKQEAVPTTQESIQKLLDTEELLMKKQAFLEAKIKEVGAQSYSSGRVKTFHNFTFLRKLPLRSSMELRTREWLFMP